MANEVCYATLQFDDQQWSYENYLKLEREKAFFESSVVDKRKKDKDFGKMVKSIKKDKKHLDDSF